MTIRTLAHTIPSITGLISCSLTEGYNSSLTQAVIECRSTTLDLGDAITFNLGYSTGTVKVFTGFVRQISKDLVGGTTQVVCEDELSKAVDFFIAADDPLDPFTRSEISTEDLIGDILALADITNYAPNPPLSVTWGTSGTEIELNLVMVWSAVKQFADALAWTVYADRDGTVILEDRKPYDMGGDVSSFTWTLGTNNILTVNRSESAENLRNKVVVYGTEGISASAEASSPFLPPGFFKTAVLASPIFTDSGLAQTVADFNLALFNRLTESASITIEGDPNVKPRLFATITEPFTGMSGMWFIFQVEHNFNNTSGYQQNIVLTR